MGWSSSISLLLSKVENNAITHAEIIPPYCFEQFPPSEKISRPVEDLIISSFALSLF